MAILSTLSGFMAKVFLWILERIIFYAKGRSDQKQADSKATQEVVSKTWEDLAKSRESNLSSNPLYRMRDSAYTLRSEIPKTSDTRGIHLSGSSSTGDMPKDSKSRSPEDEPWRTLRILALRSRARRRLSGNPEGKSGTQKESDGN